MFPSANTTAEHCDDDDEVEVEEEEEEEDSLWQRSTAALQLDSRHLT
jgi:hypothetical protein